MLISDIIVRVASALNVGTITASTSPYRTSQILDWITQGVYEFHQWIFGVDVEQVAPGRNLEAWRNFYRVRTEIPVNDREMEYILPADCYEIYRFSPMLSGGMWILPRYIVLHTGTGTNIIRRVRFATTPRFGVPQVDTETVTVTMIYYRNPEEREDGNAEPDMPEPVHSRLVDFVTEKALMATGEIQFTTQPFAWQVFPKPPRTSGVGGRT